MNRINQVVIVPIKVVRIGNSWMILLKARLVEN